MTPHAQAVSLMYHDVTDRENSSGFQRQGARPYTLSHELFEAHLNEIANSSLLPALIDQVDLFQPEQHLFLTFDDGGRSALHIARRLSEGGWRGHFFIITDRIGKQTFLGASEIRQIRAMGHHVGSHSHTHPDIFWDLPLHEMSAEWTRSMDILADILGEPCTSASVPGGDASRAVLESAATAGLRYVFTSEPRLRVQTIGRCRILGRLTIKADMSVASLRARLAGRGWIGAMAHRQLKLFARRTLAPIYRMHVRRTTRPQSGSFNACATPAGIRGRKT